MSQKPLPPATFSLTHPAKWHSGPSLYQDGHKGLLPVLEEFPDQKGRQLQNTPRAPMGGTGMVGVLGVELGWQGAWAGGRLLLWLGYLGKALRLSWEPLTRREGSAGSGGGACPSCKASCACENARSVLHGTHCFQDLREGCYASVRYDFWFLVRPM